MVSNLDTPGQGEVIYLTEGVEDDENDFKEGKIPTNLKAIDFLHFNGSFLHLAGKGHREESQTDSLQSPSMLPDSLESEESTLENLRTTEWPPWNGNDDSSDDASSSDPDHQAKRPFHDFWQGHFSPDGGQLALGSREC